jgi:hypothetical protein
MIHIYHVITMLLCFPCSHSILNCSSVQRINTILIDHLSFKYAAFSKHILTINKSNLRRHNIEFTMFKYAVFSNNIIRYLSRVPSLKLFHIRSCCCLISISCGCGINIHLFIFILYDKDFLAYMRNLPTCLRLLEIFLGSAEVARSFTKTTST